MAPSATVTAAAQLSEQLLSKTTPQHPPTFAFTPFLQKTYLHSLPADRPICRAYTNGHCPLGTRCPERHVSNATKQEGGGGGGGHPFNSLVCKHWLRGLCKKGETCEFLHEFNLRKMPECNFFLRNGFCSNGDECLYLHIDPQSKLPPCPHYDRGFCPLGPHCAKKHVRKKMCPYFLAGFCPDGRECKEGAHPKWKKDKDLEKPQVKAEKREEDIGATETVVNGIEIVVMIGQIEVTEDRADLEGVVDGGEVEEAIGLVGLGIRSALEDNDASPSNRRIPTFLVYHVQWTLQVIGLSIPFSYSLHTPYDGASLSKLSG